MQLAVEADGHSDDKSLLYVIKNSSREDRQVLIREGLGAQAYQRLCDDLMAGRYEPGQKLKLRELAARLGVSVTPVREALARLIADQAVVQVDHRSVRVSVMSLGRFNEVRELRLELEGRAAERAAHCASPADIEELQTIHERLLDARVRDCYAEILLANQQFHLCLCRSARMPVLLRLVENLWLQCGPLMNGMTQWPSSQPAQHPHVTVIKALRAGDGGIAREALQANIITATEALRRYLTAHADRPEWAKRSLGQGEGLAA
jgi:DNA-binding GntR family transcriptional regulator